MNTRNQSRPLHGAWERIQYPWQKGGIFLLLIVLPLWGSLKYGLLVDSWSFLLIYVAVSVVTFIVYRNDKGYAQSDSWRISENTLHLMELFGGWPGALLAQQAYRHKTNKCCFNLVLCVIVVMHEVFWINQLFPEGKLINVNAATIDESRSSPAPSG